MSDEESIDPLRAAAGDRRPDRGDSPPITPDDEPSALERGIRIFERLRRQP